MAAIDLTCGSSDRDSHLLQHTTQLKVRFYELDPYFHVNHAVYMSYFETARVEALESVGLGLAAMDDKGFRIVVTNVEVAFKVPVLGGETVDVVTKVIDVRRASHHWHQEIMRQGDVAVTMHLRAAMTDREGRPVRVPDFFREAVTR